MTRKEGTERRARGGAWGPAKDVRQEVVLGDVELRGVRGLERAVEIPAVDFGFNQ